jgi:hypothetical protein
MPLCLACFVRPPPSRPCPCPVRLASALASTPVIVLPGRSFVAVATSAQLLRIYSPSGRQLAALSLPGPAVALAAAGHALLAAHQAASPCWEAPEAGSQRLAYLLLDVARHAQLASGPLPLARGAPLAWLGFSEEGLPAAADGAGVVRLRTAEWGGAWVPVFDARLARSGGRAGPGGGWGWRCRLRAAACALVGGEHGAGGDARDLGTPADASGGVGSGAGCWGARCGPARRCRPHAQ